MTAAERQKASRRRRREAALRCTEDLRQATDDALLSGLAIRLKDSRAGGEFAETAQYHAGRIVGELCRRHALVPDGFVMVTKKKT
jgi:hypothetical protein